MVGNTILERRAEIGRLLSREEGKTLAEGIGETVRAGQIFKFFAGEALRIIGEKVASVRPGVGVEMMREPVGVFGVITPWNFPIAIPAWKTAPALAFGNTVLLKPANETPACAHALAEIIHESGIPNGVFNLVKGGGGETGQAIVSNKNISGISFTGSVSTGHNIGIACATSHKRMQLEMGGKNPLIVLNDANLDQAVEGAINGAFYSTGQRCTASSRIIVESRVHDQFVDALRTRMDALCVGDALEESTDIGPVVSEHQLVSNLNYVDLAKQEVQEVVGGERLELGKKGFYQRPALFLGASNTDRTSREEIFGPCASVIRADNFEDALDIANDTEFGLSAGIYTQSLKHAIEFKRKARAGMVMVNLPTAGVDYHVAFGGSKGSSFGPREQGAYAKEFFTQVKTSYESP